MAKENSQKIKLLKLMELLRQETDEQHPMADTVVCQKLNDMEVACDRKTLTRDIQALNDYGYEVMTTMIIQMDDNDEYAKRFDNFMYGFMIVSMEQMLSFIHAQKQLRDMGTLLERRVSIPQIKAKLPIIKEVNTDAFGEANDILLFEKVRKELRELIKFIVEYTPSKKPIITHLTDSVIDQQEGAQLDAAYDFEDYCAKVNRYVNEHGNMLTIYKLTYNIPFAPGDYQELERVLTSELGSKEDYVREFGDTPFGLLIRKIAKLDHDAAMEAFSQFINDQSLNQKQIAFLHKIINHIEQNGYMENVTMLIKPPFDKPLSSRNCLTGRHRQQSIR